MTFSIELENALRYCNADKVSIHPEGDWTELRLQGIHPILQVRLVDDCVFRRHIAGKLQNRFRETGIPLLVCGNEACLYYSGKEIFRVLEGNLEDSICRVIRGGVSRDEMFLPKALRALATHYLKHGMENLDFGRKEAVDLARFMGFDTALYPPSEVRLTKRYLLFRWIALYLLYRITKAFQSDPVMVPVTDDPGEFLREMWSRYYSHLEGMSDVRVSLGSPDSPDLKFLATWDQLPSFTADVHWITGFSGGDFRYYHLLPLASFVEEDGGDLLMDTSRFVSGKGIAVFSGRFGLAPLYVYRERRLMGMDHPEAVRDISVFTSPGAGEVFHSILLNLAGEGVPYRPAVRGVKAPPMRWEEYSTLLGRSLEERPFSTVLMDWRGRDDVQSLVSSIDYLWDVSGDRILLILDATERNMDLADRIFKFNRVEVIITHQGTGAVSFLLTGRGAPSMNYTKLVRFKQPLEPDMVEIIENAENRLDSNMVRLNIPVRGSRFFYYRDSSMWLVASLQEKFMKWGGAFLSLVPGYVWKALSHHRWIPIRDLARVHVGNVPCPPDAGEGVLWISARGMGRSPEATGSLPLSMGLIAGKETFRIVPVNGKAVLCGGGIGLQLRERDRERLLKWFLKSRIAFILYRMFGIDNLPVPDLTRFEGDPDKFFSGKGEPLKDIPEVPVKRITVAELTELMKKFMGNGHGSLSQLVEERIFDDRLRERIVKAWKKRYGESSREMEGGRLF